MKGLIKIRDWDRSTIPDFMFPKRDGHQVTLRVSTSGEIAWTTRTPIDITDKIPWVSERVLGCPKGYTIIGELWAPGYDCSAIKTLMNDCDESLRWEAFAIYSGPDGRTGIASPGASCEDTQAWFIKHKIPHVSWQRPNGDERYLPDELLKRMLKAEAEFEDYEGYVLKDANMTNMWKWKPKLTIDLVITGHEDGKGKYLGQLGALRVSTKEGYEVAKVSGMTDALRLDLSVDTDSYIGQVAEVEYQTISSQGRLRHPRFKRLRDDKTPDECSIWQEPRLVNYHFRKSE